MQGLLVIARMLAPIVVPTHPSLLHVHQCLRRPPIIRLFWSSSSSSSGTRRPNPLVISLAPRPLCCQVDCPIALGLMTCVAIATLCRAVKLSLKLLLFRNSHNLEVEDLQPASVVAVPALGFGKWRWRWSRLPTEAVFLVLKVTLLLLPNILSVWGPRTECSLQYTQRFSSMRVKWDFVICNCEWNHFTTL